MKVKEHNVPALRFPEFDGEWENKKLGKINTQMQSGLSRLLKEDDVGLPVIRSNNIAGDKLDLSDIKYWYRQDPQGANVENYLLTEGDLLINFINSVSQIGKVAIYENKLGRDAIITTNLMRLKFSDEVESKFIFYFFLTEKYKSYINSITKPAVNQASFTTKDLGKLLIPLPRKTEQQKIASFLTAVDTKIEQLRKKKALLEQYKKSMMQKLFSQELSFKDEQGNDFPEWETRYFGELYEFKSTNSFSRNQLNYETGKVQNIHYGDIHTKFKPKFEIFSEDVPFINSDVNLDNISDDKLCKEGDLVIADASENYEDIGKTIEIISLEGAKVLAGLHTLLARPSTNYIYIGFSSYMMVSSSVRKQIKLIAQGAKVLGISGKRMEKIKVPIPTPEEQRKIADFLSSIDKTPNSTTPKPSKKGYFNRCLFKQVMQL